MSKVDYQNKVLPWYHLSVYSVSGLFFREGRCGGDSHRHMFNSSVKIFHTSSVLQLSCNYHLEWFSVVNFPAIWSLKKRTYLMYWWSFNFMFLYQWFLTLFDLKAIFFWGGGGGVVMKVPLYQHMDNTSESIPFTAESIPCHQLQNQFV